MQCLVHGLVRRGKEDPSVMIAYRGWRTVVQTLTW
jgi:hypothetical protein